MPLGLTFILLCFCVFVIKLSPMFLSPTRLTCFSFPCGNAQTSPTCATVSLMHFQTFQLITADVVAGNDSEPGLKFVRDMMSHTGEGLLYVCSYWQLYKAGTRHTRVRVCVILYLFSFKMCKDVCVCVRSCVRACPFACACTCVRVVFLARGQNTPVLTACEGLLWD